MPARGLPHGHAMQHPSYRFAFVSNSSAIAAAVRSYAASLGMRVEIRLATMEEAVPVARELLDAGTEVILGGGATGKLLRQHLQRPVVTIARSHLDVLRALLAARQKAGRVGLTCYNAAPQGLDLLEELLGIRITPVRFTSTAELRSGIAAAVAAGAGCIVGGGICAEIARDHGCPGIVVAPGEEVMQRALEEAVNIAASQRQEREQAAWLGGILDSLHEGIVGVDAQGRVITCNQKASRLLEADMPRPGSPPAATLRALGIPHVLEKSESAQDAVRRVAGRELLINSRPIVLHGEVQGAVAAFRPASDIGVINRNLKEHLRRKGFTTRHTLDSITGDSPAIVQMRQKALRFARTEASILIQGETGTGKELLAHAIHAASSRRHQPFVAVNCAALPESLLESELFGHDEGAFTGARRGGKDGLFSLANEGSIFLDEIGDISPAMQALLLRVLDSGEIMRVGGDRVIPVNVRVISSSWKDLAREVQAGRFRADLYYRLTTLSLHVPPLRHRVEDIPAIARGLPRRRNMPEARFSDRGLRLLSGYSWPGNVRELEALVWRYALLLEGGDPDDSLLEELLDDMRSAHPAPDGAAPAGTHLLSENPPLSGNEAFPPGEYPPATFSLKAQMERSEREILTRTLRQAGNNRALAARMLGVSANTLWRKLKGLPVAP